MTSLQANILLLLAAAIWGFAFVAQRVGMDHVGPLTFNAIRFALGGLSLIPLILATRTRRTHRPSLGRLLGGGALVGTVLFAAAAAQQIGIVTTTAGKAGFITGLYVVFVPLTALLWGERTAWLTWLGAALAVVGLYLLSMTGRLALAPGDAWVLLGAVLWAVQIQLIAHFTKSIDPLPLAAMEFAVCSLLSWIAALLTEPIAWAGVRGALVPILYGGFVSVGVAYTLQAVAQRHARPTPAAIIMSLESAFAALGGWLVLGEQLGARGGAGAALMMAGMMLAQVRAPRGPAAEGLDVPPSGGAPVDPPS